MTTTSGGKRGGAVRRGAAALAVLLLAAGCAVPPSTTAPPGNAEEVFVRQTVTAMAEALTAGDANRFLAKVSDGYYGGYTSLEQRVRSAMASRTGIQVSAEVEQAVFEGPKVTATVRWSASWTTRPGGSKETASGVDRLVFMRGLGLKLIGQTGETLLGF